MAFFAKVSSAGDRLLYAGGLAALGRDCGMGANCFTTTDLNSGAAIAVDASGSAYVAGNTYGSGLPTTPGVLRSEGTGGFVAKIDAAGNAMAYVTLLGPATYFPTSLGLNSEPATFVAAIVVDASGDAYIAGSTSDPNFPATASAFQPHLASTVLPGVYSVPQPDGFVAKLNPSGSVMVWATFLGGRGTDSITGLALDSASNVFVVGYTSSTDFPQAGGFPDGVEFLAELNAGGSALRQSQLFPSDAAAAGIGVDATGAVHVAGSSGLVSGAVNRTANAPQIFGLTNAAGGTLAGRVTAGEVISIYGVNLGPSEGLTFAFNAAGYLPNTVSGTQVAIGGIPAPLLYVSATQINAVVPVELAGIGTVLMQVSVGGATLTPFRLVIDPAIPEVFRTPSGYAAAINQDGSINSAYNPAQIGTIISVWASGAGLPLGGADGQKTVAAQQLCSCEVYAVPPVSGGAPGSLPLDTPLQYVPLQYAGPAPGMVTGVVQINFQVTTADRAYVLTANRRDGDPFFVYVR